MNNTFFLVILPMRSFTIHLGSYQGHIGLSLRGSCTTETDASHLLEAVQQLLEYQPSHAWVDCQWLHSLSDLGKQALLQADATGQLAGATFHWCGLPLTIQHQLLSDSRGQDLYLLPASEFQGPTFLLPGRPQATVELLAA